MTKDTSWDSAADWYGDHLASGRTYQSRLIWPGALRLMGDLKDKLVADVACGEGSFASMLKKSGAGKVYGFDSSKELIKRASRSYRGIKFEVAPAEDLPLDSSSVDAVSLILAIQNMEFPAKVLKEISGILKKSGRLVLILNHPAFRVPGGTSWGFDDKEGVQYRRVNSYMTESKTVMKVNPGKSDTAQTINFHRPLQNWFKMLKNAGFLVETMEEWCSDKESGVGPRKIAEDRARKEFPLFMAIVAVKK